MAEGTGFWGARVAQGKEQSWVAANTACHRGNKYSEGRDSQGPQTEVPTTAYNLIPALG